MALVYFDDDPWLTAHDACEKLCRDIQVQLVQWSGESRTSNLYDSLSSEIRMKLKQFNSEISQLKKLLETTTLKQLITDGESERRSRQIEVLHSKYLKVQVQFNDSIQSSMSRVQHHREDSSRRELFANGSRDRPMKEVSTADWGTGSDDEEMIDAEESLSVHHVKKHQEKMIQEQNRGLDELSKIIAIQKGIATSIDTEITIQNEIIDDLGDHVDRTGARIQSESAMIRQVSSRDNTCGYWSVIIILFVAIVLVAVIF